jgi:hypothetical protein
MESLSGRVLPAANLTVTFAAGTLTVVGDAGDNDVTVKADPADTTHFTLTSTGTVNGQGSAYSSPAGVKNFTFKMLGGSDTVTFDNTNGPFAIAGNVSIDGGSGSNTVNATGLTVEGNLTVTNRAGSSDIGTNNTYLNDLIVRRSVSIKNASGTTYTRLGRLTAGFNLIGGNVTVTNGTGVDYTEVLDTNVGGSVTVSNGHGANGLAGYTRIENEYPGGIRSVIRGNVIVNYLDGDGSGDGLYDAQVFGNVTFNHGAGLFTASFNGHSVPLPVVIRGNLTLTGSGTTVARLGTGGQPFGLVVGKNLTVTSGAGADNLTFFLVQVGGTTRLNLGNGDNTVQVDDSVFAGKITMTTGTGVDRVRLDTTAGTGAPSTFERPVSLSLGTGDDILKIGAADDSGQKVVVDGTFVAHHGVGNDTRTIFPGAISFAFGDSLQWVQ